MTYIEQKIQELKDEITMAHMIHGDKNGKTTGAALIKKWKREFPLTAEQIKELKAWNNLEFTF